MVYIKEFLFGRRAEAVCQIKLGVHTTYPPCSIDEQDWKNEFRVGMLYDRKIIHLN